MGSRSFNTGNMGSVGQRAAKLLSVNFENDSNRGGVKPGPNMLAHTLAVMAEAADSFKTSIFDSH